MAAKTFKNATGATLVIPGMVRDVTVLPNKYVQGDFYYGFNSVNGAPTTTYVYEVCGLTLVPDGDVGAIDVADIVYVAVVPPYGGYGSSGYSGAAGVSGYSGISGYSGV